MKQLIGLTLGLSLLQSLTAQADDLFRMTWRGTVYITSATGQVIAKPFSERDFINRIAINNGLDSRTLAFVYRPTKHDTAIVRISTGEFIADVIQMENAYTQVNNTSQTKIVRQAYLWDELRGQIGSAFGSETARYDAEGNLVSDSFRGTFQYSIRDGNPYSDIPTWLEAYSPPFVFSGSFTTGARIVDRTGN